MKCLDFLLVQFFHSGAGAAATRTGVGTQGRRRAAEATEVGGRGPEEARS